VPGTDPNADAQPFEKEASSTEMKKKALKLKRRCPGCFVSAEEDPVRNDQELIDYYAANMHPSQHIHCQNGGCMTGEPVSSDEEEPPKVCRICSREFFGSSYNGGSCRGCMHYGGLNFPC